MSDILQPKIYGVFQGDRPHGALRYKELGSGEFSDEHPVVYPHGYESRSPYTQEEIGKKLSINLIPARPGMFGAEPGQYLVAQIHADGFFHAGELNWRPERLMKELNDEVWFELVLPENNV